MSQYGANKVATAILLDLSPATSEQEDSDLSFFQRSKRVCERIILRKLFAYEIDEVGVLSFSGEGVSVVTQLGTPTWKSFWAVRELTVHKDGPAGNWAKALIAGIDFLEQETQGKKFKSKQLVVLSNFSWTSPGVNEQLQPLVTVMNGLHFNIVVIGLDLKKESQNHLGSASGIGEMMHFVAKIESGVALTFEEVEEDIKLYEKRKKAKRLTKCFLKIGSQIKLPFKWMKITNDDTRLKFAADPDASKGGVVNLLQHHSLRNLDGSAVSETPSKKMKTESYVPSDDNQQIAKFNQYESKKTRFGATEVLVTYADIESLKRSTGPASLTLLGTVKSSRISRSMIVSQDVYIIVPDGTKRSQVQLSALVDALLKQSKYGLVRRVGSTNGKVSLGILLPVSDDLGQALYFLKLPFADWVKTAPIRPLPGVVEESLTCLMSDLIDKMSFKGDILIRDPNFQLRSSQVENVALTSSRANVPSYILDLYDPYPNLKTVGFPVIKDILATFPIPPPPPRYAEMAPAEVVARQEKDLTDCQKEEIKCIEEIIGSAPDDFLSEDLMEVIS